MNEGNANKLFFLLVCFFTAVNSHAQSKDSGAVTIAKVFTFYSKMLDEDRKIYIHLPPVDSTYLPGKYPVLYLTDGEEQMAMVTGQVMYLSESFSIIPPVIVVGIGNTDRTKDLTPTHSLIGNNGKDDSSLATILKTSGGGENFLRFMKEELVPYIEKNYPAAPFRVFCGHSLGGLMAVYTLLNHTEMFNAYIAVSPSLWWDEQLMLRQSEKWKPLFKGKKFLFFSDGKEGGQFHKDAMSLDTLLKEKKNVELKINYTYYPGEPHAAEPVKATYDALRFIFPPVYPPELDTLGSFIWFEPVMITRYYKMISEQNGYVVNPPEAVMDRLGHYLLSLNNKKNNQQGIELLEMNAINYPGSWHVHYSLGEVYDRNGGNKKAAAYYKRALALNPENKKVREKLAALQNK